MTQRRVLWQRAAATAALCLLPFLLSASQSLPAGYAGSELCMACHEDIYKAFQRNAHASVDKDKKRGWEGRACEGCHGPGAKHAESAEAGDILNPAKASPSSVDRSCLQCHANTSSQVGRIRGGHGRNEVSCAACHTVHAAETREAGSTRAVRVNRQCAGCHTDVWASFQRPHGHKLGQGAMTCVDCHNPHGSFLPKNIQTVSANEPNCFRCHGDKRGPFVYEHAPVRLEGCSSCHEPHGSANPRMLTRQDIGAQCLECHANIAQPTSSALGGLPPAIHDMRSPRFRQCTTCHLKIHGSQTNRTLLR